MTFALHRNTCCTPLKLTCACFATMPMHLMQGVDMKTDQLLHDRSAEDLQEQLATNYAFLSLWHHWPT